MSAAIKLSGHFARNPGLRAVSKGSVDLRRLKIDSHLRQEVATAVRWHLRATPPGDNSMDDVDIVFAAAIIRTSGLVVCTSRSAGQQGEVGVETSRRELSCRQRLRRCMHPKSA